MKSAKMDHDKSFEGCGRSAGTKYPRIDILFKTWGLTGRHFQICWGTFSGPFWTKVGLREFSNLFHFQT